jgi:hypothetical protein
MGSCVLLCRQVDDLINIFSEPVRQSAKPQKLSLSMLQYNIMRVIIALFPLFRIIKQLLDLFKWERPAASMLALLVRPQSTTYLPPFCNDGQVCLIYLSSDTLVTRHTLASPLLCAPVVRVLLPVRLRCVAHVRTGLGAFHPPIRTALPPATVRTCSLSHTHTYTPSLPPKRD